MQSQPASQSFSQNASRLLLPLAILAVGIAVFWFMHQRPAITRATHKTTEPLVETTPISSYASDVTLNLDGVVVPSREIELATEVAGRVEWKSPECRAGNYVSAGAPLIRIESIEYDLEAERLLKEQERATVEVSEVAVEMTNTQTLIELAQEDLDLQIKSLNRTLDLAKQGVVTEAQLDTEKQRIVSSKNTLTNLQNQKRLLVTRELRLQRSLELVAVQLKRAELDQKRTTITAPISGLIVNEAVEQNDYVSKSTPLLTIDDTSHVEIRCSLQMDDLHWLWSQKPSTTGGPIQAPLPPDMVARRDLQIPQAPVTVVYNSGGRQFAWTGTLSRFEGVGIDEMTRTVPCRVVVPNPRQSTLVDMADSRDQAVAPPALMRGMFVDLKIHIKTDIPLVSIPGRALRPGNRIWKFSDGELKIVDVKIAQREKATGDVLLYARNGELQAGEKIIDSPLATAFDGLAVKEKSAE